MITKPLYLSTISDIHLGARRNQSGFIIDNLNKYITCDEHLSKIDMLVFVGDIFDGLLSLPDEDVGLIDKWISNTLKLCYKYKILVRILEGTPSHDRNQSQRFEIINEILFSNNEESLDLKYVKTLSIEHIDRFGIDVLYVPDEWNHTTEETLIEVKNLLSTKGLTSVDFAFMHGCFDFQMPAVVKPSIKHISNEYLSIVKYLIFVGHIHQYSQNDRIFSQGSFDRLAHGEMEAKGFLSAIVNPDASYEVEFIENITARKFITISCTSDEIDDNLKKIEKVVKKLPNQSFVRIEADYKNVILADMDVLARKWPLLIWSSLAKNKDIKEEVNLLSQESIYTPIKIDKTNLSEIVLSRISNLNLSSEVFEKCKLHLKDMEKI